MVFHWSLSDSKSLLVSWTLLTILADLNNTVIWIVLIRPLTSNTSSPLPKPLRTIQNLLITIGITVTLMFHSFLSSIITIIITPYKFFKSALADGFSLKSEWQQVSSGIQDTSQYLVDLNNTVFKMVLAHTSISNFSNPLIKPLGTVPSTPITIGITITFQFHSFFVLWQGLITCLSFCFLWFSICGPLGWQSSLFQWTYS